MTAFQITFATASGPGAISPAFLHVRHGDRPDAGLQPDIFVVPTVNDIARGRDAELDAVRTQVRRHTVRKRGK